MSSYIVDGGNLLRGDIKLQGCKNSVLPILAASILNRNETILHNVPNIKDVATMIKILRSLGCSVEWEGSSVIINSRNINNMKVSEDLVRQMRSSIIFMGSLVGLKKESRFAYPGGCEIGIRPIDLHLKTLRMLGANIYDDGGYIVFESSKLKSANIQLDFPSVGATENLILASVFANGVTSIGNCAKEPEIIDLQNFLNAMGARVYGAGSNTIYIEGVQKLDPVEYSIMPDRIVAGTYMCMVNACGGDVFIKGANLDTMKASYYKLLESGAKIKSYSDGVSIISDRNIKAIDCLITQPYPGFPTDMQSQFGTMLCLAKGVSIINETIFENRFNYMTQLKKMGADIRIKDRLCIISGVGEFKAANVYAQDLRGGASLVMAAICANGKSKIDNIEYIERGYEDFSTVLNNIGAKIRSLRK